jgi:hypothetical protein
LRVPLDGAVRIAVRASGGLRPALALADGRRVLARGRSSLRYVSCGRRVLRLTIRARRGSGRFNLTARTP